MSNHVEFEKQLEGCVDITYCHHDVDMYFYYQTEDNTWMKIEGCQECVEDEIGCIFCGGMYNDCRIYKVEDGVEVKVD